MAEIPSNYTYADFAKTLPTADMTNQMKLLKIVRSAPATPAPAPSGGFFDNLLNFADKALNFADRGSKTAESVMDRIGQAKARMKTIQEQGGYLQDNLRRSYDYNIRNTPRDRSEDWIPGIPNVAVIAGAAGVLLLIIMMKKGD